MKTYEEINASLKIQFDAYYFIPVVSHYKWGHLLFRPTEQGMEAIGTVKSFTFTQYREMLNHYNNNLHKHLKLISKLNKIPKDIFIVADNKLILPKEICELFKFSSFKPSLPICKLKDEIIKNLQSKENLPLGIEVDFKSNKAPKLIYWAYGKADIYDNDLDMDMNNKFTGDMLTNDMLDEWTQYETETSMGLNK